MADPPDAQNSVWAPPSVDALAAYHEGAHVFSTTPPTPTRQECHQQKRLAPSARPRVRVRMIGSSDEL
jgi:hypothetical protein